jgi:biotin transport system substrate-specific component
MSQNTQAAAATKSKFSVRDICYAGLFAAVIAVMAQLSIPMPLGVPMTMQTFAITLAAVVLGSRLSAIATLVYLALGAVGVPVLAIVNVVGSSIARAADYVLYTYAGPEIAPPAASSSLSP